jgi:hypothetical protein
MKLSEIQGERAIEVIADLVEPIADIAMDKSLKDVFKVKVGDGETAEEAAARTISQTENTTLTLAFLGLII